MSIDDQTLRALAFAASRARPHDANHWREPVVMEILRKLADRKLADVALALFRAADDRSADMPHVLLNGRSPHWRERDTTWTPPAKPFDRQRTCGTCGYEHAECQRRWASDHRFEPIPISSSNAIALPPDTASELHDLAKPPATTTDHDGTHPGAVSHSEGDHA